MKRVTLGLSLIIGSWFILTLAALYRSATRPLNRQCDRWIFATDLNQKIISVNGALQAYAAYAPTTPLYQDVTIPLSLSEFRQKFNLEPYWDTQTVLDQQGQKHTIQGYNMVLSHLISPDGKIYKYQMCRQGKPIN